MTHPTLTPAQLETIRELAAIGATVEEMAGLLGIEASAIRTTEVRLIIEAGERALQDSVLSGLRTLANDKGNPSRRIAQRLVRNLDSKEEA